MQKIVLGFLGVIGLLTVGLVGQNAPAPSAPELTKMEQIEVENLQLKQALVNQAINEFQLKYNQVEKEIEANHPGWQLQGSGAGFTLVKKAVQTPPTKTDRENQKEVQKGAAQPH